MNWDSALKLDPEILKELINRQFPALRFSHLSYLDAGWDSLVYETDTGVIFKFPKRLDDIQSLSQESQLLQSLQGVEAIPVPKPAYLGKSSELFPGPFFGYPKLPGQFLSEIDALPADWLGLARQAGLFLTQLSQSNPALILPVKDEPGVSYAQMAEFPKALKAVRPLLPGPLAQLLKRCLDEFEIVPKPSYTPCLTHGDLSSVHILYDSASQRFCGVIDWAGMALANPIIDFVGFFAWGGEHFFEEMLPSYHGLVDEDALPWLKQKCLVMGLFEAYHSLETKNLKDRKNGLQALKTALS